MSMCDKCVIYKILKIPQFSTLQHNIRADGWLVCHDVRFLKAERKTGFQACNWSTAVNPVLSLVEIDAVFFYGRVSGLRWMWHVLSVGIDPRNKLLILHHVFGFFFGKHTSHKNTSSSFFYIEQWGVGGLLKGPIYIKYVATGIEYLFICFILDYYYIVIKGFNWNV